MSLENPPESPFNSKVLKDDPLAWAEYMRLVAAARAGSFVEDVTKRLPHFTDPQRETIFIAVEGDRKWIVTIQRKAAQRIGEVSPGDEWSEAVVCPAHLSRLRGIFPGFYTGPK